MGKSLRVCVVLPAYNEATVIKEVILSVVKVFKKEPYVVEIVVVDDGSTDRTASVAKKAGATIISHIFKSGVGSATATGLSYAERRHFDVACTMDADGQHTAEDVLKGITLLTKQKLDLLIGSRLIDTTGMSKTKILGNKGLSVITYLLFGISSTDSQSGLRIYSHTALEQLRWRTSGYEFCSEMLWRAKQLGLRIDEYPIQAIYTDYSRHKGQNNWNALTIVSSLVRRRVTELFE